MAQVEFDDRDRPRRLFLVAGEARIEAGLRGEDLSALRLGDDLSICGQRLFADLDGELVRVSEQVVEPVRILVGAGRRGEYVDTDGLNVEPNVHPRLFASTRLEPVENCIERRVIEKLASSPHRERRPASLTERRTQSTRRRSARRPSRAQPRSDRPDAPWGRARRREANACRSRRGCQT